MKYVVTIALASAVLSGCATPEFINAQNRCSPQAYQDYPIIQQQRWETRRRQIQIQTDKRRCVTTNNANQTESVCEDVTEPRWEDYVVPVMVNINKSARGEVIDACARNICVRSYGNPECKVGK